MARTIGVTIIGIGAVIVLCAAFMPTYVDGASPADLSTELRDLPRDVRGAEWYARRAEIETLQKPLSDLGRGWIGAGVGVLGAVGLWSAYHTLEFLRGLWGALAAWTCLWIVQLAYIPVYYEIRQARFDYPVWGDSIIIGIMNDILGTVILAGISLAGLCMMRIHHALPTRVRLAWPRTAFQFSGPGRQSLSSGWRGRPGSWEAASYTDTSRSPRRRSSHRCTWWRFSQRVVRRQGGALGNARTRKARPMTKRATQTPSRCYVVLTIVAIMAGHGCQLKTPPKPLAPARYETLDDDSLEIAQLVYVSWWRHGVRSAPCLIFQGMDPDPRIIESLARERAPAVPGSSCVMAGELIQSLASGTPRAVSHHSQERATRIEIDPDPRVAAVCSCRTTHIRKTNATAQVIRVGKYHWLSAELAVVSTSISEGCAGIGRELMLEKQGAGWKVVSDRVTWRE